MSSNYAIFSYSPELGVDVPVGIALWSTERRFARIKVIDDNEKIERVTRKDTPFVALARDKVLDWMSTTKLPYGREDLMPWENAWWQHVRELLIHRMRISAPRPIDCKNPSAEIDIIYEAVLAPHRSEHERAVRVDGEITRCLASLAKKFGARKSIVGYGQRPVVVTRSYEGKHGYVVVEGVNLAANPDASSDEALGKLLRVRDGVTKPCKMMVGYVTSPEGLNGESVLIDFLRSKTGAETFDLARERDQFFQYAQRSVDEMDGKPHLIDAE